MHLAYTQALFDKQNIISFFLTTSGGMLCRFVLHKIPRLVTMSSRALTKPLAALKQSSGQAFAAVGGADGHVTAVQAQGLGGWEWRWQQLQNMHDDNNHIGSKHNMMASNCGVKPSRD